RQPGLREAGGAGALSRGLQIPARPAQAAARGDAGGLRPGDRLAALPGAGGGELQGAEGAGAAVAQPGAGGRLIGIHSHGDDPGLEIIRRLWPDENPFTTDRHQLLRATKAELGPDARDFDFKAQPDDHALFRYTMHALPG